MIILLYLAILSNYILREPELSELMENDMHVLCISNVLVS